VSTPAAPEDAFAQASHDGDERRERIRLETSRHRIEGLIVIAADGYRSRVSDVLNASERDFLTLTDVTLQPLDGGTVERHEFLAVARTHVVYVVAAAADGSSTAA
jgi:2-polyprenyl-6-methoxyphenol hydroxylase-like FAD-dependent oxidoreductase